MHEERAYFVVGWLACGLICMIAPLAVNMYLAKKHIGKWSVDCGLYFISLQIPFSPV